MTNTEIVDTRIHYLGDKITLSPEEVLLIRSVCVVKKLKKKQYLLHEGEVWKYHAFAYTG